MAAVLFGGQKEVAMSQNQYNKLVVRAARKFLKSGGSSLELLQQVIGEVFGKKAPENAANDVLTLCRQAVLAA